MGTVIQDKQQRNPESQPHVDLERGVRQNGQLIASDIQGHIEQIRTIAQQEGRRENG